MATIKQAKAFAKEVGFGFKSKAPNNSWGGYENGSEYIFFREPTVYIISTCMNCGDGNWIDITKLAEKL